MEWREVTSLAEVWIETLDEVFGYQEAWVTSLAEVWIETPDGRLQRPELLSLPLRKCGLKLVDIDDGNVNFGHFPCGSVD